MRSTLQRLILLTALAGLTGTCLGQWRHFGEATPLAEKSTAKSSSLPREMVSAHNAERARVGTKALTWSDQLAAVAQDWANGLMANGQFVHSRNPNYGENLYEITGAPATPATVVNAWAGEVKDYNYPTNSCRGVCGHYTQVVWSDTKEVGCAVARGGGREVWVCEYSPPGNWVGRKPY